MLFDAPRVKFREDAVVRSQAADLGLEMDQQILSVKAPTERWHKELMWLPGFLLFGVIVWLQRRRAVRP